nr:hypothetical protein BaRGS_019429 [Batillaria attramentaria]
MNGATYEKEKIYAPTYNKNNNNNITDEDEDDDNDDDDEEEDDDDDDDDDEDEDEDDDDDNDGKKPDQSLEALVDDLPTDLVTMALVESKNALSGDRLCSVCEDDIHAASFCFDCVISVVDVAKQERGFLAEQARKLRKKEAEFASQINQLEKEVRDAQAHFSTMRSEVKANCERLQHTVTKRREQLTSTIKEQEDRFLSAKASAKSVLEEQKTAMAAHASTVEDLVVSSSDSVLLGMLSKIKGQLIVDRIIMERLVELDSQIRRPVEGKDFDLGCVTFDPEMVTRLERAVTMCGRISSKEQRAAAAAAPSEDKISLGSAIKVPPVEEPKFVSTMSAKTPNDSCEPSISSMTVTGGNILVMTDITNNAVKATSLNKGGNVVSFSFPPFIPCCVAALEGGKVALTLYSCGNFKFKGIRLLEMSAQPTRATVLQVKEHKCTGPQNALNIPY